MASAVRGFARTASAARPRASGGWNEPDFASAGAAASASNYSHAATSSPTPASCVPTIAYTQPHRRRALGVQQLGWAPNLRFRFGGTRRIAAVAGLRRVAYQLRNGRSGENPQTALYALAWGGWSPSVYGTLFHYVTIGDNTYPVNVTIDGLRVQ